MCARILLSIVCAGLLLAQQAEIDKAWDLLARGENAAAASLLKQVVVAHPGDGEARLLLGSVLSEAGEFQAAIGQLEEATTLMPDNPWAHNALGEALSHSGRSDEARPLFEKAVSLDPNLAPAHINLGLALLETGEQQAAATHLDRAISLLGPVGEAAFPLYLRAKIHSEEDEVEEAASKLERAVKLEPVFAEAWSDLGLARETLLDDDGALEAFRHSVELDPKNAVSQYRLGAQYSRRGEVKEAVLHLQASYRLNPTDQSTLYSLQMALRRDGQTQEANRIREELAGVLREIDGESQRAFKALRLNNEGAATEKAGNLAAAVEKYRAAVELDPTHAGIRVNFAVALLRLGHWKEGLEQLREAVRREPANEKWKTALDDALRQAPVEFGGQGQSVPAANAEKPR